MVISCSAINCSNRQNCGKDKLQFHKFPLKNKILCKKWMLAVRRSNWKPTRFSRLCGEHFTEDDYKTECKRNLKSFAVPSIFNFEQSQKNIDITSEDSNEETTRNSEISNTNTFTKLLSSMECSTSTSDLSKHSHNNKGIQTKKTRNPVIPLSFKTKEIQTRKMECPEQIKKLTRKAKVIQQRLRRRQLKISRLEDILGYLTNTCEIPESELAELDEVFGDVLLEIQMNWRKVK